MPPSPFRDHIRAALANPQLQAALDGNAERRLKARQIAYASLPEDLQVMRQRAHRVRADLVAKLDHYLEEFTAHAQANGIIVHPAADAAQAVHAVREIASQAGAKVIAKSKTMVGEEIDLNHALEGDGLQVVETDLGEYIVQLRGEPPAHIITPAVHLSRSEVGQTFHEKLGLPFTDDIPALTAAARRVLRQTFLRADIGISGVNFGVAESGALCLLTNEGNGRMVTTLPEIHIALMGIERLVPTYDDLALMLYLLPRSATGQKLTVYTSLIYGPRRPDELDGPRQRHLILLDNGRRALRQSSLAEALYCIRCGACLNACPVFREIGGHAYLGASGQHTPYPGPIGSVVAPGLFGVAEFGNLARASSLCGACKEACPVDIDLPKLLLRVRAAGAEPTAPPSTSSPAPSRASHVPGGLNLGLRLFTWIARSPARFTAAQRLAGALSRLLPPFSGWLRLPAFTGWGYSRDIPCPAARPFRDRFTPTRGEAALPDTPNPTGEAALSTGHTPENAARRNSSIDRLEAELVALGGAFTRCREDNVAQRVVELLRERGIATIQAWEAAHLPGDVVEALKANGIQVQHLPNPGLRAGLTSALAGIAETGSLILPAGAGRPQTASLLPEIHIAILRARDIFASLPEALRLPQVREASAVVLISGPSRTADIEMTLTIGVHGPGELHVLCVE